MCRNLREEKTKGRGQEVVEMKCGRGAPTSTRSEGMVVTAVLSCLGYSYYKGMNDRG